MNKLIKILLVALVLFPVIVSAQLVGIKTLFYSFGQLVDGLILIVVGIALLAFFWGLVKFIFAQGSEASKLEAKKIMGWGLVALFVMISVWGLVRFMQRELLPGADYSNPRIPSFKP